MFAALFKRTDSQEVANTHKAEELYASALAQIRKPVFYTEYGVPDTFDGRFDLLLVHLYLILSHLMKTPGNEDLSQALFDVNFRDMDQTLREMGIGDMGVPKHMRRMMQAFNGRMHAYQLAIEPEIVRPLRLAGLDETNLEAVLRRNLFATNPEVTSEQVQRMVVYIQRNYDRADVGVFEEP